MTSAGRPGAGTGAAFSGAADPDAGFDLAPGFRAAATACGLKPSGALDLALVWSESACTAAALFTTNPVQAAPVTLDREILALSAARIRGVIANSGCANACTGERGMKDARDLAALAAGAIGCAPEQVLVLSTGVIGRPLEMEKLARGVAALAGPVARGTDARGAADAARSIMTTDTRPKTVATRLAIGGQNLVIAGFAKGAGMIHPDLATMLAVLTTDARLDPTTLDQALRTAAGRSFNRITVDGDTSTNDTVVLLASGASGVEPRGADLERFIAALTDACATLARMIARDGEGATRLVEIRVTGARDEPQAHRVANRIACSPLVKTAIHGGDPNWGRIVAAAGASGAGIDPVLLALEFAGEAGPIRLVAAGLPVEHDPRAASAALRRDPVGIRLDLGLGTAECTVWTCDLSAEYVAINAHYTT